MKPDESNQAKPLTYLSSPLLLTPFDAMEDELFGLPGTPERSEYEARVAATDLYSSKPNKTLDN